MKRHSLPLSTRNFGEWLAALGVLRAANAAGDRSAALSFDSAGLAQLDTTATESDLVTAIKRSTEPSQITVRYFSEPSKTGSALLTAVGDKVLEECAHNLGAPEDLKRFLASSDAKYGCIVQLSALKVSVRHFAGNAVVSTSSLDSPIKTWSGQIVFHKVLMNLREKVASSEATTLDDMLGAATRETQRLRLDHRWEDYFDDGCCSLGEGTTMRPSVEWLAFAGLSFFPPEAGFDCISPGRHRLQTLTWSRPLESSALVLALHSGQLTPAASFQIVVGGQFEPKKIRFLESHTPQPIQSNS